MKVKRSTQRSFCEYCGESFGLGRHGIPLDLAQRTPKEKCPRCQKETLASCILGIGDRVYVCKSCGREWDTITKKD